MKYFIFLIVSLPIFIFPFLGNKSISWEIAFLIFGYFWFGVVLTESMERQKKK